MYNLGVEAFLAVVRTQKVSRAAVQLNLAQSTVSKRLKVLEQELGTALFERGKGFKAIRLTSAGEAFIELAERWDSLRRDTLLMQTEGPRLSLSIGTIDSIINSIFPALYRTLQQHQPKIRLQVITSHSVEAYEEIERRQVDVAFSLLERVHSNVVVEKCYTEPMVVLRVAEAPQVTEDAFIHPQELDSNDELYVRWGSGYQIWHDQWWDPSCPGRSNLDTAQLSLMLLKEVEQWTIVPLSVALAAQERGTYHILRLSEGPPDRIVYKLTHKYPKSSTAQSLKIFNQSLRALLGNR